MEYNAKKELYHFVDRLRIDWGVTSYEQPFNAIEMSMYHAEIIYHTFDTDGFCGAAFTGNRIDTIVLNDTRSSYEQNFDCGHEIIHLTKHRDRNGGIFQCFSESQDSYLEWEANGGAAQLLVPYQDFIPRFLSCLQSRTASQHNHSRLFISGSIQEELAAYYHVSSQVINIRLSSLGYEIDQYRCGIPLESVELLSRNQRDRRGIQSTCYNAICGFSCDYAIGY